MPYTLTPVEWLIVVILSVAALLFVASVIRFFSGEVDVEDKKVSSDHQPKK